MGNPCNKCKSFGGNVEGNSTKCIALDGDQDTDLMCDLWEAVGSASAPAKAETFAEPVASSDDEFMDVFNNETPNTAPETSAPETQATATQAEATVAPAKGKRGRKPKATTENTETPAPAQTTIPEFEEPLLNQEASTVTLPEALSPAAIEKAQTRLEASNIVAENWIEPTNEQLQDPVFKAIWNAIRTWSIELGANSVYKGSIHACGQHAIIIYNAIMSVPCKNEIETKVAPIGNTDKTKLMNFGFALESLIDDAKSMASVLINSIERA